MPRKAVRGERRLSSLNMKTTEALRAHLENEAARSGRTLTHEVEYRLERSFAEDGTYTTATNAAILRDIAGVFQLIGFERASGANRVSRAVLNAVLERIVAAHLPDPAPEKSRLPGRLGASIDNLAKSGPDMFVITDDTKELLLSKCISVVDSVIDSSSLTELPPVVSTKKPPFGFHSSPFSPSGVMARVAGKPASLSDLLGDPPEK